MVFTRHCILWGVFLCMFLCMCMYFLIPFPFSKNPNSCSKLTFYLKEHFFLDGTIQCDILQVWTTVWTKCICSKRTKVTETRLPPKNKLNTPLSLFLDHLMHKRVGSPHAKGSVIVNKLVFLKEQFDWIFKSFKSCQNSKNHKLKK